WVQGRNYAISCLSHGDNETSAGKSSAIDTTITPTPLCSRATRGRAVIDLHKPEAPTKRPAGAPSLALQACGRHASALLRYGVCTPMLARTAPLLLRRRSLMSRFQNILVGIDLTRCERLEVDSLAPLAHDTLHQARWLARKSGGRLTLFSALNE